MDLGDGVRNVLSSRARTWTASSTVAGITLKCYYHKKRIRGGVWLRTAPNRGQINKGVGSRYQRDPTGGLSK